MVGMQHRPHVRTGQQECCPAVATVAVVARIRLEESECRARLHPHVRLAGRPAGLDGHGGDIAPWRDLRARASEGVAGTGRVDQCGGRPRRQCRRQPHLRGLGCRRQRRHDDHRPQEAAPGGLRRDVERRESGLAHRG